MDAVSFILKVKAPNLLYIRRQECIHQSLLSHKLVDNGDVQTLNCRYSFGIRPKWPKVCVALVTRYDLLPQQNLDIFFFKIIYIYYLKFLFWIYPPLYTSRLVAML